MYHYDRERSNDRRERMRQGRSPSSQSNERRRHKPKQQSKQPKNKTRRVKFLQEPDVRVFRKEDQPTAKPLQEDDILKFKNQIEKEISKNYDWEDFRHRDAKSESNSMKEQKEKEKAMNDKLMAVKQGIPYYNPSRLANIKYQFGEPGCESEEKRVHSMRIRQILGCYYTHVSQIPNQPQFQILNPNTSNDCRLIKFDNDTFSNDISPSSKKLQNTKPLKGILKMPQDRPERQKSQPRTISPELVTILRNLKQNASYYGKELTQKLLKPFRDSGQLEYLTKNKEMLERLLRDATPSQPASIVPSFPSFPSFPSRESNQRASLPKPVPNFQHQFVPKADKYRTVPCKYYHGPQGCTKITNCTFIHDQRFQGVPVPNTPMGPMGMGSMGPMGHMGPMGSMPNMGSNIPLPPMPPQHQQQQQQHQNQNQQHLPPPPVNRPPPPTGYPQNLPPPPQMRNIYPNFPNQMQSMNNQNNNQMRNQLPHQGYMVNNQQMNYPMQNNPNFFQNNPQNNFQNQQGNQPNYQMNPNTLPNNYQQQQQQQQQQQNQYMSQNNPNFQKPGNPNFQYYIPNGQKQ